MKTWHFGQVSTWKKDTTARSTTQYLSRFYAEGFLRTGLPTLSVDQPLGLNNQTSLVSNFEAFVFLAVPSIQYQSALNSVQ